MILSLGAKGRLKATKMEFEIVGSKGDYESIIKFKGEKTEYEVKDSDLHEAAEGIEDWGK